MVGLTPAGSATTQSGDTRCKGLSALVLLAILISAVLSDCWDVVHPCDVRRWPLRLWCTLVYAWPLQWWAASSYLDDAEFEAVVTCVDGCGAWCLAAYCLAGAVHAMLLRSLQWRLKALGGTVLLDVALALLVPLQRSGYTHGCTIATKALLAGVQCIYLPTAMGCTVASWWLG